MGEISGLSADEMIVDEPIPTPLFKHPVIIIAEAPRFGGHDKAAVWDAVSVHLLNDGRALGAALPRVVSSMAAKLEALTPCPRHLWRWDAAEQPLWSIPSAPEPVCSRVCAAQWTDEWKPTAPTSMSAREAAVEILAEIDWTIVLEDVEWFGETDPLVLAGLAAELNAVDWRRDFGRRFSQRRRVRSHLTAWVTARLTRRSWCMNDAHHDEMIPFDDCWGAQDDGDGDCMWDETWALDGDPGDFLRLAAHLLRDGWEPDDPLPNPTGRPLVGPAEFQDRGYLQELNRRFLHPLGMALALDRDVVLPGGSFPVQVWDYRDDPEGFLFVDLSADDAAVKASAVEEEGRAKVPMRSLLLGHGRDSDPGPALIQRIGSKLAPTDDGGAS